jgi:3-hydroxyacyl-[acyl-carrier-protein] dehydratase
VSDELTKALASLPHGPDFRFIDRLLALDPGHSASAEYRVRGDEPFLRGHFPNEPLFPGVLLIEAAAQVAGIIAQAVPGKAPMAGLKLTALRGAKIFGTARPGETLQIEARITGRLGMLVQASATICIAGKQVLQTELTLSGDVRGVS